MTTPTDEELLTLWREFEGAVVVFPGSPGQFSAVMIDNIPAIPCDSICVAEHDECPEVAVKRALMNQLAPEADQPAHNVPASFGDAEAGEMVRHLRNAIRRARWLMRGQRFDEAHAALGGYVTDD